MLVHPTLSLLCELVSTIGIRLELIHRRTCSAISTTSPDWTYSPAASTARSIMTPIIRRIDDGQRMLGALVLNASSIGC